MKNRSLFSRLAPLVLLALAAGIGLGWPAQNPAGGPPILSVPSAPGRAARLRRLGLDLLADWEGRIYVLAPGGEAVVLRDEGLVWSVETDRLPASRIAPAGAQTGLNGAYHSYKELEQDLYDLQTRFPDLAKVVDLGLSLEKRHLFALKITAQPAREAARPEVLFLGCHHAREWISVEVPFQLGRNLVENYALDPEVRRLVDAAVIWIVPLVNPDGLEYSIQTYRYWRKNRRDSGSGSFGVDLNRDYGYAWGVDNIGSSPDPGSEVYRGSGAFSEPEVRAVRDFFLSRTIDALVSYHSFAQTIVYPWGYTTQPAPDDAAMGTIAARMSDLIQAVNGRTYTYGESSRDMYLTNGDLTDWAYAVAGIPAFTIELPPADELHGGFFNAEADIASIFAENRPAMLYLIDWAVRNGGSAGVRSRDPVEKPGSSARRPADRIGKR